MSEHDTERQPDEATTSEIPPLGPVLRAAREARGESLYDVAAMLKLSVRQLQAIEEERFGELPGPAFAKGFVRNYGRHLGIDVEPLIAARWGAGASGVDLAPLANAQGVLPVSGSRPRLRRIAAPLVLLFIAGALAWWYFDGLDPQRAARIAGEQAAASPAPEAEGGEASGFPPADAEPAADLSVLPPQPAVIPLPPEPSAVAEAAAPVEAPAAEAQPPAEVEDAEPEPVSGPGRLVFRLDQESWLDVRDARDRRLYSGVGTAGSVRAVQGQPPFTVVIGNARAVRLEHAGREVDLAPHTSSGGVARLRVE